MQMEETDHVLAELDVILNQATVSSEDIYVIIKDLYHESACSTVQTAALHLLTVAMESGLWLHEVPGSGCQTLGLSVAKSALLTLALPAHVQRSNVTAAQAIKQHVVGRQLTWSHLDSQMCQKAGRFHSAP